MDEVGIMATFGARKRPQARALVRDAACELRLDGPTTWELMLATTEAVANAIEHGEPCDPGR